MNMKTAKTDLPRNETRLSDGLNQVLADSYALMALTHLAHWNVEGPGFFALHTAFQTQYEELFTAIDEIAERVRALGAYATGGLDNLAKRAQIKEFSSPLPSRRSAAESFSAARPSAAAINRRTTAWSRSDHRSRVSGFDSNSEVASMVCWATSFSSLEGVMPNCSLRSLTRTAPATASGAFGQSGNRTQTSGGGPAPESQSAEAGQPGGPHPATAQGPQVF
jgi:starvation-inducible DNA-binding protein